jgi:parallel beta-helix repeat protein
MKKILLIIAVMLLSYTAAHAQAGVLGMFRANYFVAADGNDANSGKYPWAPIQTIEKLNTLTLLPGQIVAFKRGDTFAGTITVGQSGTSGKPITYTWYGSSGEKPIITAFTTVTGWTNEGGGIYSKTLAVESNPEIVTINGVQYAMGRTPNADRYNPEYDDYYHIDAVTGTTQITDSECNAATTDWDGAEIVIRSSNYWDWIRTTITTHSSTTLTFTNSDAIAAGFGYFIQDDLRTLDQFGEWYYGGGKFYMYFGAANPTNYTVKVSTKDELIDVGTRDYITVKNLKFEGANDRAVTSSNVDSGTNAENLTVDNCDFDYNYTSIYGRRSPGMTVTNCNILRSSDRAIYNHWNSDGAYIANNVIDSTSLVIGAFNGQLSAGSGVAIMNTYAKQVQKPNKAIIEYNTVTNTGHTAVFASGDSMRMNNNFVHNYGINRSDVGGLYKPNEAGLHKWMSIDRNIIVNGILNTQVEGLPQNATVSSQNNIYLDYYATRVSITNNFVSGTNGAGIYLHGSDSITVTGNTIFDSGIGIKFQELEGLTNPTRVIVMSSNKIISKELSQQMISARSLTNDFSSWGTINNNQYAYIVGGDVAFVTMVATFTPTYRDFSGWKTASSQDAASESIRAITEADSMFTYYNYQKTAQTYSLPAGVTLIDIDSTVYSTSITLQPFTGKVLWKVSTPDVTSGMFAAYNLEESSGSVLDELGVHNGTATRVTRQVTGKTGYGYDYDSNTAGRIIVNYSGTYPSSESRTLAYWVKLDSLPSQTGRQAALGVEVLGAGQSYHTKWAISISTANKVNVQVRNTSNTNKSWLTENAVITQTGVWYRIVILIPDITNSQYVQTFVNGINQLKDRTLLSGTTRTSDNYYSIGTTSGATDAPAGVIDKVYYYGRHLSPVDIWDDYINDRTYD